jgi:hypothetical protein
MSWSTCSSSCSLLAQHPESSFGRDWTQAGCVHGISLNCHHQYQVPEKCVTHVLSGAGRAQRGTCSALSPRVTAVGRVGLSQMPGIPHRKDSLHSRVVLLAWFSACVIPPISEGKRGRKATLSGSSMALTGIGNWMKVTLVTVGPRKVPRAWASF